MDDVMIEQATCMASAIAVGKIGIDFLLSRPDLVAEFAEWVKVQPGASPEIFDLTPDEMRNDMDAASHNLHTVGSRIEQRLMMEAATNMFAQFLERE